MVKTLKRAILNNVYEISIFVAFLILYVSTTSHGIVEGDTGDFLSAAAVGGVPHQPGYPLYSFFTRVIYLFHFSNPAFAINAFSAALSALTLSSVYKISHELTHDTFSSFFSVITLGIFESFWWYSLVAEIYALQLLLLAFIIFFLIKDYRLKNEKYFYLAVSCFALGISNHLTIIFMFPLFIFGLYVHKKKVIKIVLISACITLLGFVPYLYTFYASSHLPPVNWGRVTDLTSFFHFFFRSDAGTFQLGPSEPPAPFIYSSFIYFFKNLFQTSWYLMPFFMASLFQINKNKTILAFFTCWILFGPVFFAIIALPIRSIVHQSNVLQYISYSYLFFALLSGVGLNRLLRKYYNNISYKGVLLPLSLTIFFMIPFLTTYQKVREDNDIFVENITKTQLSLVPKNGVLLVWSDSLYFPTLYLQYVKHYRPDIKMVQTSLLNSPWYQKNLIQQYPFIKNYISQNQLNYKKVCAHFAGSENLFMFPWFQEFDATWQEAGCQQIPYGLIVKIIPLKHQLNIKKLKEFNDVTWKYFDKENSKTMKDSSTGYQRKREALFYLSEFFNFQGIYYENNSQSAWAYDSFLRSKNVSNDQVNAVVALSAMYARENNIQEAISVLEEGVKRNPTTAALYKNLGVLNQNIGNISKAVEYYQLYLSFNPASDPEAEKILQFVTQYQANQNHSTLVQ